jgi:hypothetical protein
MVATACLFSYVSGEPLSEFVPVLVLVGLAMAVGAALLQRTQRRRNDLLLKAERLFDSPVGDGISSVDGFVEMQSRVSGLIEGRMADFSLWQPEPPAWSHGDSIDDRRPAFGIRIACDSPVGFEVRKWGITSGPPFRPVKLDNALAAGEPVNFTTKSLDGFTFWRERQNCRELACHLVQKCGVLELRVARTGIVAWCPLEARTDWSALAASLPPVVDALLELARALDGRGSPSRGTRKCPRCSAGLARPDVHCPRCGAPWWEEEAAATAGRR